MHRYENDAVALVTLCIAKMDIIESSIIGKKNPETCEDGMVITDDFIAVIDGREQKLR